MKTHRKETYLKKPSNNKNKYVLQKSSSKKFELLNTTLKTQNFDITTSHKNT